MRTISFIASLLLITYTASAKFMSTTENSGSSDNDFYDRIEISYNPISLDGKFIDWDLKGITVGQVIGFNVTNQPLFIEIGGRLTYATRETSDTIYICDGFDVYNSKLFINSKFIQISVPINVVYKFTLSDDWSIAPFAGLVAKGNIFGETETEYEFWDMKVKESWFDKRGMDANRFQAGWNIGVGANYKNFYLGVSYGADFIELADNIDTSNYAITFGYSF